ncbi:hypothetical protein AA12717_3744 [Gluconacetobacter sacchari DSM 12717]|uniref:Uncharacterized protein n=2 Tax=Gluconacetobacter sacchari TaxID=92759 RepID=A0A7W4NJL1_9PROT|nr:hypothetical protein [Gluconacetobacter sacchari]MBB2158981.1 hypothetical protein [Gluconacetobacter sacchari]GBQ31378.1 hypothetical protein AA12717_3744 [Gluconacetobacter sacchari DSM 12717]
MIKIVRTSLSIAAGTMFLSAASPIVSIANMTGTGAALPGPVQALGQTIHQIAQAAISNSGLPLPSADLAIGPNLEAPGRLEFGQ